MKRTDIHRPAAIQPEDYEYVGQECAETGAWAFIASERKFIKMHMERTGGTYSHHEHGGNCAVCGNVNAIYTHLFYHAKTNSYVRTGSECTAKLDHAGVAENMDAFKARCKRGLEVVAGKKKAQATLAGMRLELAWMLHQSFDHGTVPQDRQHEFVWDVVGKLIQYGKLSDKQFAALDRACDRLANVERVEAERAAKTAAAQPVPVTDKRIKIVGTMLSFRRPPEQLGGEPIKCLIETVDGWRCWGSLAKGISTDDVGSMVEFSAKVKVSDKDPKFGFYSRPTKAKKVA